MTDNDENGQFNNTISSTDKIGTFGLSGAKKWTKMVCTCKDFIKVAANLRQLPKSAIQKYTFPGSLYVGSCVKVS